MAHPSPTSWPRPAVPGPDYRPPKEPETGPDPGQVAAAIAAGVLCLWTPFTLILALVLSTVPDCTGSRAAICTHLGHLTGMWAATTGAALGLTTVATAHRLHPRRHQALYALTGLALAAAGLLLTVGFATTTPTP